MMESADKNKELIKRQEALRLKPYRDTEGKLTIGYGRNLDDVGISQEEAELLFEHDYDRAVSDLHRMLPWTADLDSARHEVLVNMAFNMGIGDGKRGLTSFKNTLELIQQGRYVEAASNMLKSKWASQVGPRAVKLAHTMETGRFE